jgi:hypothetical protein
MKIYRHSIFPSIISEIQCETYNEVKTDMLTWIYEYSLHNTGICVSNRGGWHSTSDMHHQASFDKIKTYIEEHISVGLLMYNCNFKIDAMWININQKGNYNACHDHRGMFSFVIWVKIPYELKDELNLYSKSAEPAASVFSFHYLDILGMMKVLTLPIDKSWEWKMILFPSKLNHSVNPFFTSNELRISVAGNVCIKS